MHEREKERERKKKVENQSLGTMQHQPSLHIAHKATELVLECIAKQMPTSNAVHMPTMQRGLRTERQRS